MEEPKEKPSIDLSSIDAINSLDTARMTLRWALERIHLLEKTKIELEAKSGAQAVKLDAAQRENEALRHASLEQLRDGEQRARYYAQLEEVFTQHLSGKLPPHELARREFEAAKAQETAERKQLELEAGYADKLDALTREHERLKAELLEQAQARSNQMEESLARRRELLDKEHVSRMAELHERGIWQKLEERELLAQKSQAEGILASQRMKLERELHEFRTGLEEEAKLRNEKAQRVLEQRLAALQSAWNQEKELLLKEASEWKRVAQEELKPQVDELYRRWAAAQDAAQHVAEPLAQEMARRKNAEESLSRLRAASLEREQALLAELEALRERGGAQAVLHPPSPGELSVSRGGGTRPAAQIAPAQPCPEEARERELLEERLRNLQEESRQREESLRAELEGLRKHAQAQESMRQDLDQRLVQAAGALQQAHEALALETGKRQALEESLKTLELESKQREKALSDAGEDMRRQNDELLARALETEREIAARKEADDRKFSDMLAAEAARMERVQEEARAAQERAEQRADALSVELQAWRKKVEDKEARILELERHVETLHESMEAARGEVLAEGKRLEEERSAWNREREALVKDLKQWRDKTLEQGPMLQDLQRRLAQAQEEARLASEASAQEAAHAKKLEHKMKGFEAEYEARLASLYEKRNQALLNEIAELRRKIAAGPALVIEAEQRKAEAENAIRGVADTLARQESRFRKQEEDWRSRESELRERLSGLEQGIRKREEAFLAEAEDLRKDAAESRLRLMEAQRLLAAAEEKAQQAVGPLVVELEEYKKRDEEAKARQAQLEAMLAQERASSHEREPKWIDAVQVWRGKAEESQSRLSQVQQRLDATEAAARQVSDLLAQEAQQRAKLEEELQALQAQVQVQARRIAEALAKVSEHFEKPEEEPPNPRTDP